MKVNFKGMVGIPAIRPKLEDGDPKAALKRVLALVEAQD